MKFETVCQNSDSRGFRLSLSWRRAGRARWGIDVQMDGHHEHRSSDGSTYSGEWRQGMRWGQGTQTYALTGNVYSGAWVDGRWHGYGELKLASGCCYQGERCAVVPARL